MNGIRTHILRRNGEWLYDKNKQVEVKLYTAINKQKVFVGELIAFDDNGYTIKTSTGEELFFEKEKVAICLPVIEF